MSVAAWWSDLRVIASMLRGLPSQGSASSQLAAFYGPQAADYDRFRERLLHGRAELIAALELAPGQHVIEFGAGTGRNVERFQDQLPSLRQVDLVDLCGPLLEQAYRRLGSHPVVHLHQADATTWQPAAPADRVYFSYALSMIPPWFAAIDNAERALAPGGLMGVVDFQVAPRGGSAGGFRQGRLARHLWPLWFDHDGVRLSADLLPYLCHRFEPVRVEEHLGAVPWMAGLRVPYFVFVGRKRRVEP